MPMADGLSGFFAPTFGSEAIAFSICVKRSRKEDRFSTLEVCAEDCARTLMPTDPRVYNE